MKYREAYVLSSVSSDVRSPGLDQGNCMQFNKIFFEMALDFVLE